MRRRRSDCSHRIPGGASSTPQAAAVADRSARARCCGCRSLDAESDDACDCGQHEQRAAARVHRSRWLSLRRMMGIHDDGRVNVNGHGSRVAPPADSWLSDRLPPARREQLSLPVAQLAVHGRPAAREWRMAVVCHAAPSHDDDGRLSDWSKIVWLTLLCCCCCFVPADVLCCCVCVSRTVGM